MANQRKTIRMSDQEAWAFIGECRNLQFATLNRDGSPHLTTLSFYLDDEAIFIDTFAKAQKAVNVGRDPRVCLLFEKGIVYEEMCGATVNGRAELVEDPARSVALKTEIAKRYDPDTPDAVHREASQKTEGKRIVFRVVPEKIISWDHRKL